MIELCRVYSFLGRSTGIQGHNNVNIRNRDEELGNQENKVV